MKDKSFEKILKSKSSQGMTLIELLVVVSIISILVFVITVFLRPQIFKANDARRKAELKRIGVAAEEYEKDNNCYPPTSLVTCVNGGIGLRPYIDVIPCDPVTKNSYFYEPDPNNVACPKWYRIYASLQNQTDVDYIPNIGPSSAYRFIYTSPNAPALPTSIPNVNIYYGCINGSCRQLIEGEECTPNWDSMDNCNSRCPENPCI